MEGELAVKDIIIIHLIAAKHASSVALDLTVAFQHGMTDRHCFYMLSRETSLGNLLQFGQLFKAFGNN